MKKILLYILILLFVSLPCFAATHTLTDAQGEVVTESDFGGVAGGDTIIISASRTLGINFDTIVGASGNPVIITNPSDSKVTLSNATTGSHPSVILVEDSRYLKFTGTNYSAETYGIRLTGSNRGIKLIDTRDFQIEYLEIDNMSSAPGIANNTTNWTNSTDVTGVIINNNYIHDISGEAMYLGKSDTSNWPYYDAIYIHNNLIEDCTEGIQLNHTKTGTNNRIVDNTIIRMGSGFSLPATAGFGIVGTDEIYSLTIGRNYIRDTAQGGATADGIYLQVDGNDVIIEANFIISAGDDGMRLYTGSYDTKVRSNTIISSAGHGIKSSTGQTAGEATYNLIIDSGDTAISSDYVTQADNRTQASVSGENFFDTTSHNYRLTGASAARNAGSGSDYSTTDFDGRTRPIQGTADIGAHEWVQRTVNIQ